MSPKPCLRCGALGAASYCRRCRPARTGVERRGRRAFRRAVLAKTGGRCAVAGCPTPWDRVEAHHVRPLSEGGADDPATNGVPLCATHHAATDGEHRRRSQDPSSS